MTAPSPTTSLPTPGTGTSGWGALDPQPANVGATPDCYPPAGGHLVLAPPPASDVATSIQRSRVEEWDALSFPLICLAENLSDVEAARIATANRLRSLQDQGDSEVTTLAALVAGLDAVEHQAELALRKAMRRHPLGPWVARSKGVGEKQAARLIAAIGNPYWNSAADRPRRGPAELWAYCGFHVLPACHTLPVTHLVGAGGQPLHPSDQLRRDPHGPSVAGVAPRRRKGAKSNWNNTARMRARLVAESCIKQMTGTYRPVYDVGRAKYLDASVPDAQKHARALRLVAKAVLRDMWVEARDWHLR